MEARKKRVLLIDDEPSLHKMMRLILELAGYEMVGGDPRGSEAQEPKRLEPDLIVLDLMMPEVDGYEVLRRLKQDEETKHIPVVICTVRSDPEDRDMAMRLGASRYVLKPFDPEDLIRSIEEALREAEEGEGSAPPPVGGEV
jgi:CheY-like chemotaxis protein